MSSNSLTPEIRNEASLPRCVGEAFALAIASVLALLGFQLFLDNAVIINTNGLWKSVYVRAWAEDPGGAALDFSNLLYFPVYGLLCRWLDGLGVFPGEVWRQMAVLNAGFAGAAIGGIYFWIARICHGRLIGFLTIVFYLGSGFFLALSIINEDIMPGHVFSLAGMILAGAWFGRPSALRILGVAVVITLGWLFEWRLLFPVLPPMLLALWLSGRNLPQRLGWPVLFLGGLCILPGLLSVLLLGAGRCADAWTCFAGIFWTGKGIGTGWAGFTAMKVQLAWVGMTESVIGGRYLGSENWRNYPIHLVEVGTGTLLLLFLGKSALREAWTRRRECGVVATAVIFGGTFLAGEVFNLYSQPQDPQMQLTVMPWIIPAWAIFLAKFLDGRGLPAANRPRWKLLAAVVLSVLPLVHNAAVLARHRGGNARHLGLLERLELRFDPARTVFLYRGFEFVVPWQWALWSAANPGVELLPPAPAAQPKFKWISVAESLIRHPGWTPDRHAADLVNQVERALRLGYQVMANEIWAMSEDWWVQTLSTVGGAEKIRAIRQRLMERFQGAAVYEDPVGGSYFRLAPRRD